MELQQDDATTQYREGILGTMKDLTDILRSDATTASATTSADIEGLFQEEVDTTSGTKRKRPTRDLSAVERACASQRVPGHKIRWKHHYIRQHLPQPSSN